MGVDVVARIVPRRGLALQPRVGTSFDGTVFGASFGWVVRVGAGIGWIVPVRSNIALVTSAGYDLVYLGSPGAALLTHRFTAELAAPLLFDRGVLEPFVQLGASVFAQGADVALAIGLRGGITW
jgi:hypothetical protein